MVHPTVQSRDDEFLQNIFLSNQIRGYIGVFETYPINERFSHPDMLSIQKTVSSAGKCKQLFQAP